MRKRKRYTLEEAAQQAGIHRVTLNRWEKGHAQPRLSELNALLTALDANSQQRQTALSRMETSGAFRQVRIEAAQVAEQRGMPSLPHGGDLLYALRMRRGITLEEAAHHVEVTDRTLRRWEKMEVWPSVEQLHRLCYALSAHEEEIVALTLGQFSRSPRMEQVSVETVRARLEDLKLLIFSHIDAYPLFELTYLQLEADAWPLALRSNGGKQALIEVYASHAQVLSTHERFVEANDVADQSMVLMRDRLKPQRDWLYPVIVSARASVYRGEQPAPKRGLERLRPWSAMKQWPEMHAWLLADMAKYLSLGGESEAALSLVEQACREVENAGNHGEWILRQWDKASLLLQAGRPAEALAIVAERTGMEDLPSDKIDVSLLRAEAYLDMGNLSEAHDWLQKAQNDVDTYHLEIKQPLVQRLAVRF